MVMMRALGMWARIMLLPHLARLLCFKHFLGREAWLGPSSMKRCAPLLAVALSCRLCGLMVLAWRLKRCEHSAPLAFLDLWMRAQRGRMPLAKGVRRDETALAVALVMKVVAETHALHARPGSVRARRPVVKLAGCESALAKRHDLCETPRLSKCLQQPARLLLALPPLVYHESRVRISMQMGLPFSQRWAMPISAVGLVGVVIMPHPHLLRLAAAVSSEWMSRIWRSCHLLLRGMRLSCQNPAQWRHGKSTSFVLGQNWVLLSAF